MYYIAKIEGCRIWNKTEEIQKVIDELRENKDNITGIELSSNSIGLDVAKALSEEIKVLDNLIHVNYRDIFVGRLKADLPKSLLELVTAINGKNIQILDLSDNAFGPIGVQSFDFFLRTNNSLKELYVENNGLGPEGAETLANSLLENDNIKLEVLSINRNRLEDKGGKAFAKVFTKMGSFKKIQLFQNGIKEDGMAELILSFGVNSNLEVIKINDNLIKDSAPHLIQILPNLEKLSIIDISDSLLGNEHSLKIFQTFSTLKNIKEIYCNYNEIEKKSIQKAIFEVCLTMEYLEKVQLKGNEIEINLWKKFKKDLKNKIKSFEPYSEEEDIVDDDEDELVEELEKINIK